MRKPCKLSTCLVLSIACVASAQVNQAGLYDRQQRVDAAISAGVKFLMSQLTPEGPIRNEYPSEGPRSHLHGGQTALAAYALLSAGVDAKTPELQRALKWVAEAEMTGTYAIACRSCAFSAWNTPTVIPALERDAMWLVEAAGKDGSYSYTSKHGKPGGKADNSNSQFALLGVWAAWQRGIEIPHAYWELIEQYWTNIQLSDGGWNYRTDDTRKSYGSMTAAGLASLFITRDVAGRVGPPRIQAQRQPDPLARGLKWLGKNFRADSNPNNEQWWYYWLYSVERVALASGYKYFGDHNWYSEGADRLLALQNDRGHWGNTNKPYQTAFAMLFLVRGRYPILINKLKYPGRWNARPRDAANLTRWLGWTFERPVSWQIVDIDASADDWHDAPILYISGAGPCDLTEEHIRKLRRFALSGGLILSEAAANNGDFTLDMQRHYRTMFPHMARTRLAPDDPVYSLLFKPKGITGLSQVSNGLRPLIIHSPRQLSDALQTGYKKRNKPNNAVFELLANIYLYATDKGILLPRGQAYWPKAANYMPKATVAITPVSYDGNYNPEPLALERLAVIVGNRHGVKIDVTPHVRIADLDATKHPLAVLTGTEEIKLSEQQLASLGQYFRDGGTMIIDAAGGSRDFDRAVYRQILPLPEDAVEGPLPADHEVFMQPERIEKPIYRRNFAMALGSAKNRHRLRGVWSNKRLAILYSRDDITGGLVGYQLNGLRGYAPGSAETLMTNMIFHAAQLTRPGADELPATTSQQPQPTGDR